MARSPESHLRHREYNREYRLRYKGRILAYLKEYGAKTKQIALEHYSGGVPRCDCCGEKNIKFLTIDHVNNDGKVHRQTNKEAGWHIYRWLRKNNFPGGFRVLCYNCNMGRAKNNGVCPHKEPNNIA
jgi:hypothetical protein